MSFNVLYGASGGRGGSSGNKSDGMEGALLLML